MAELYFTIGSVLAGLVLLWELMATVYHGTLSFAKEESMEDFFTRIGNCTVGGYIFKWFAFGDDTLIDDGDEVMASIVIGGVTCLVFFVAWPVMILFGIWYGFARFLRLIFRMKNAIGKLGKHTHSHPSSVEQNKVEIE